MTEAIGGGGRGTTSRLLRDVLIYGGGEMVMRASGFVTLPIYARALATQEYGAWGFMLTLIGLLAAVVGIGSDSAFVRFYFECETPHERRVLTSTWIGFLAAWTSLVSLILAGASPWIASWFLGHGSYSLAVALALVSTPLTLISALLGEALRNQFRPVAYTVLNGAGALSLVGFTAVFVLVLHKGLTGVALGLDLSLIALLPVRAWVVRDHLGLAFDPALLRRLLSFGYPLVPVSLAYWIFAFSDRFVLAKLSTLKELGLYTVAGSMTAMLGLLQAALSRGWSPHALQMYQRDREAAAYTFGRFLTFILLGFAVTCVAVSAFAHELLVVLATPDYYGAAAAIGPLALGYLAYASTQVTAASMTVTKRTGYLARISWAAALLNLALNLALVPIWGMLASAWATAAAYLFLTGAYAWIGQRLWRVQYDYRRAITITVAATLFTVGAARLPDTESVANLAIKLAYVVAFCITLVAVRAVTIHDWRVLSAQFRPRSLNKAAT